MIVSNGRTHDAASLPALIAESNGSPVGLLTYTFRSDGLEVISLDALREGLGAGSALLERATAIATALGCRRIWLVTSNDNLDALGFYQRRGFTLSALRPGAVDVARRTKPGIPTDTGGIAVRDEIELQRVLTRSGRPRVWLQPVTERERGLLGNLLQLYIHEFSSWRPIELNADGRFAYRYFDAYFTEPGRHAWIIRNGEAIAGFAMVREREDGRRDVSEFFVVGGHRRCGVGRAAASLMFDELPGAWEVRHDLDNDEATTFWPSVIGATALGEVERSVVGAPEADVEHARYRFSTT